MPLRRRRILNEIVKRVFNNFKKYRFLMMELIKKDIKLKYRKSYLGILWTLLEPLLTMLVLTLVFSSFYGKKDQSFPVYILAGRMIYGFFASGTKAATRAVTSNASMIKKVYVPKYIYPLSTIVANYFMFLISLTVLVAVSLVLGVYPTVYILGATVPLFIILVMTLGVGMCLSSFAVFFRDMEYLWNVALMLIMYASAIFYEPDKVLKGSYGWILKYNPVYACISNFRQAVFGMPLDMKYILYSAGVAFGSLILGMVIFYKQQDKFILHI